ncbi:exosome complex exonuclease RRP40 [Sporormia fimetaria CBS 119925]|uniref:Exosome complex exonuclease RRP40 n=1 Tax=Sporormia fimetaria CBS 119925 TaxID=1340428 RepID=A0A6A6VNY7_9PLEO|nr:exosome complex exonuclease RRP40 [Sporormia fimetaria CBS 119925]
MASTTQVLLPGDTIPTSALPTPNNPKKPLTLGPGLRHIPPSTIVASIAGSLSTDNKKNAAWVEYNSGRYTPSANDLVIATILTSTADTFNCTLTPHTPTTSLPHLSFENATRKTRPQLPPHSLVYARIVSAPRDSPVELTCVDPSTGKSEGLGPLKGGMLFPVSLGMARRLLAGKKGGVMVLEGLAEKMGFEVAVGRNGVVWVDGGSVKNTLGIGRALQEVDREGLGERGQRKVVERVLRGL